jgi:hypothetical protein
MRSTATVRHGTMPMRLGALALALTLASAAATIASAEPQSPPNEKSRLLLQTMPTLPPLTLPDPSLGGSAPLVASPSGLRPRGLDLGDGLTLTPGLNLPSGPEVFDPTRRRAMREPFLELKVPLGP